MPDDEDLIEELKKKLYSNSGVELPEQKRVRLHKHSVLVNNGWEEEPEKANPVVRPAQIEKDHGSLFKKILAVAILIFVLALGFAAYIFSTGANSISNKNIDVELIGPVSSPSGDELSLDVTITNNNSANLELVDLVMTYPDGTRSAVDHISSLPVDRIAIGTVQSHRTVRETVKAVLFGQENERKDIKVSLEYRLEGSSNVFVKDKIYPVFIGTSPIAVTVESVNEVIPDQNNTFDVTIKSNSTTLIKSVIFKAAYPFGFEFASSTPSSSGDNTTWILGDIQPGEERHISITGKLLGSENEKRIFNFYTGTQDLTDQYSIGTVFVTDSVPITLRKPFLALDLSIDNKNADNYVAHAGEGIKGEISYQNNLSTSLNDVVIVAKISGAMLDQTTVLPDSGYYDSNNNTITWDNTTSGDLKSIDPKGVGNVQFSFAPVAPSSLNNSTFRRQTLDLDLSIRAKRLNESNVPVEIISSVSRSIKVSSDINLKTDLIRSFGPFQNSGVMPPMPGQATTYTANINIGNSYNTVNGAVYTATLPSYVTWLGVTYPDNTGVSYNKDTRQITWNLGDLASGLGYGSSPKDIAFQVSLLPSIGQKGSSPVIVSKQSIAGTDSFTGKVISVKDDDLTTDIRNDPSYKLGDDKVGGGQ